MSTSAYERDGPGKRKRTATASTEIEQQEQEQEEIQYPGRKFPKLKHETGSWRSIFRVPRKPLPRPGPSSVASAKPSDRYSVCFGPELPPVGIVRISVRVFLLDF